MLPAELRAPRVKVTVRKEIIAAAKLGDAAHCMIAEAIRAEYPRARWVQADVQSIRFTDREKGFRYTYMTPKGVQRNLIKFDQGTKPSPFTFLLTEGKIKRISRPPKRAASANLRKAAAKGRKSQKPSVKPKSAAVAKNVAPSHQRQFGVRSL
jgi:hypothetical protein